MTKDHIHGSDRTKLSSDYLKYEYSEADTVAMDDIKHQHEELMEAVYKELRSSGNSSNGSSSPNARTAGGSVITQEASSTNINEDSFDNANCAPAALANVLKDFGKENINAGNADDEIEETRAEMGASPDESEFTSTTQIAKGARANGLNAREYKGGATTKDIDRELSGGGEAIVNVNSAVGGWGDIEAHFVVVVGKDSQGNYLVKDPKYDQIIVVPKEQMEDAMSDREGYMVAINDKSGKRPNTGADQAIA